MKKSLLLFLFFNCVYLKAAVRLVPSVYPSINSGLVSASAGDTILVAPGTYFENINWPAISSLKLFSSAGYSTTIINGSATGSVISMNFLWSFDLDTSTVIRGFQITNGYLNTTYADGGGIYLSGASPTLVDLDIHNNNLESFDWAYGAGIFCGMESNPIIVNCNIYNNTINSQSWAYGGGIYVDYNSSAYIDSCSIHNNIVTSIEWAYGGGVHVDLNSSAIIKNCMIYENSVDGVWSSGAGISLESCNSFVIDKCIIDANISYGDSYHSGGGIDCYTTNGLISNSEIINNKQIGTSWFEGAGISIDESTVIIDKTIIKLNRAIPDSTGTGYMTGGGIKCANNSVLTLRNSLVAANSLLARIVNNYEGCGIYGNSSTLNILHSTIGENEFVYDSTYFGSAFFLSGCSLNMKNSICWNSRCLNEQLIQGTPPNISYCDIRNGSTLNGNINGNPLFIGNHNYHLSMSSPCINAGLITSSIPYDLEGNARPMPAGTNPDMGAFEADQIVGIDNIELIPLSSLFPNPTNTDALILLNDINEKILHVEIYDALGKLKLANSNVRSNSFKVEAENLSSGIYYYNLTTTSGKRSTGKFVVN